MFINFSRKIRTEETPELEARIVLAAKDIFSDETDLPPVDDFAAAIQEIMKLRPIHKVVSKRERVIPETITFAASATPPPPLEDVKVCIFDF